MLPEGALLQHAESARTPPDVPHILIIEEVNRGNPVQAFGEMLTLIKKSTLNADDALTLSYPKSMASSTTCPTVGTSSEP